MTVKITVFMCQPGALFKWKFGLSRPMFEAIHSLEIRVRNWTMPGISFCKVRYHSLQRSGRHCDRLDR